MDFDGDFAREIEGLSGLRWIAGKAQADMYISTLRDYVEALGGRVDTVVALPGHPPLRLNGLGDLREPNPDSAELAEDERGRVDTA